MSTNKSNNHGHVVIDWQDQILRVETFGPFNIEGVSRSFQEIRQACSNAPHQGWARMDILDPSTLGSPDVMAVIGLSYKWCFEKGCLAIGSVCSNQIQVGMLSDLKTKTGANLGYSTEQSEVQGWLEQQLGITTNQTNIKQK